MLTGYLVAASDRLHHQKQWKYLKEDAKQIWGVCLIFDLLPKGTLILNGFGDDDLSLLSN
jgi:hypothetical protein